jgi:hypothetical protein
VWSVLQDHLSLRLQGGLDPLDTKLAAEPIMVMRYESEMPITQSS